MNRVERQRLHHRDEGRRRVRVATAGIAVAGSVLAAAFSAFFSHTDAGAAAADTAAVSGNSVPLPSYGSPPDSDDVTRPPLPTADPEPAGPAATAPRKPGTQLSPPTRAPSRSSSNKRHASSGAS